MRQVGGLPAPATFEQRLQAVRNRRRASQLSRATTLAVWIGGVIALLTVVGGGLVNAH